MDYYKIDKPDLNKINSEKTIKYILNNKDIRDSLESTYTPKYRYWDKIKYLQRPGNLSAEEFWLVVKFLRMNSSERYFTPIKDESGNYFSWQRLPGLSDFCHKIDLNMGGVLAVGKEHSQGYQKQLKIKGIIEEAIASSQLEGAHVTRSEAKEMIKENRKPTNKSEQMIFNNYKAILAIENDYKERKLSKELLLELHEVLTTKTLNEDESTRFRYDSDNIIISPENENIIYHKPPSENFMLDQLQVLINYANDETEEENFIHPVIKAILLHFWIGYLHPFTDGNGRIARAIFYWYLLRKNYWGFTRIPLSVKIKNSPVDYAMAYVYSEQDDNDLTYFIDYNFRKIELAIGDFDGFIDQLQKRQKYISNKLTDTHFNNRQITLLNYFFNNENAKTSIKTYSQLHDVHRLTARKDLLILLEHGFLHTKKVGRYVYYFATEKVAELFDN